MNCLALLASLAAANFALAGPVTLSWSAQDPGAGLCLTNGSPLAIGSTVRLGYFDLAAGELDARFADPVDLASHFTVLATTTVGSFAGQSFLEAPDLNQSGTTLAEAPGCFAANLNFTPAANPAALDGKRCYIWAMNAATVPAASYHGIYSHHAWIINAGGFGNIQWDLSQVSVSDPRDLILGHRGPQVSPVVGGSVLRLTNTAQLRIDRSDADSDGASALLEEAFAMDPTHADGAKLPRLRTTTGQAALAFTRKAGGVTVADGSYTAAGLRYIIEMSSDLKGWTPCQSATQPALTVQPGTTAGTEDVTLTLTAENLAAGCQFARVRIERVE